MRLSLLASFLSFVWLFHLCATRVIQDVVHTVQDVTDEHFNDQITPADDSDLHDAAVDDVEMEEEQIDEDEYEEADGNEVPPPLIPRSLLEGNEDIRTVKLSPDGRWLAYLAPEVMVMNIRVEFIGDEATPLPGDLDNYQREKYAKRTITNEKGRGIYNYFWTHDNHHIVYSLDHKGDENWRLFRINIVTGVVVPLVDQEGVQAQTHAHSAIHPNHIIVGINDRDPKYHDLYKIDINSTKREKILENTRFKAFRFDHELRLRLAEEDRISGGTDYFTPDNQTGQIQWKLYRSVKREDTDNTKPNRFDKSNDRQYWYDATETDKSNLVLRDFATGIKKTIYTAIHSDVDLVIFNQMTGEPMIIYENYMKREAKPLHPDVKEDLDKLHELCPTDAQGQLLCTVIIADTSYDFRKWVVAIDSDSVPPKYYLYDRQRQRASLFFVMRNQLSNYRLASTYPKEITTRDGLVQVCYLTLPVQYDTGGESDRPVPLILQVHGGPWGRDHWGFNSDSQHYANRGYAILACNFRGSIGYGKAFLNAGNKEWGRKMQYDLLDAVDWAIRTSIADPKKIAIMGSSYGGYATLAGLTMSPDKFACGVDVVGPANLITLCRSVPPYWRPQYESMIYRIGGHPETEEGRIFLRERSPLTYADAIKKPLLIAQGANDPRVKRNESDQIVAAMKRHKIPVTYVLYPDEGHGWQRYENRRSFTAVTETFLSDCLGGRLEPFTAEEFNGTSLQLIERGFKLDSRLATILDQLQKSNPVVSAVGRTSVNYKDFLLSLCLCYLIWASVLRITPIR